MYWEHARRPDNSSSSSSSESEDLTTSNIAPRMNMQTTLPPAFLYLSARCVSRKSRAEAVISVNVSYSAGRWAKTGRGRGSVRLNTSQMSVGCRRWTRATTCFTRIVLYTEVNANSRRSLDTIHYETKCSGYAQKLIVVGVICRT